MNERDGGRSVVADANDSGVKADASKCEPGLIDSNDLDVEADTSKGVQDPAARDVEWRGRKDRAILRGWLLVSGYPSAV